MWAVARELSFLASCVHTSLIKEQGGKYYHCSFLRSKKFSLYGKNVIWLLCSPDTRANYFYSLKINLVILSRKMISHFKTETLPWWSYDLSLCLYVSAITFIKQTVLHVSLVTLRSSCCNSIQTRILNSWCNASPM